MPGRHALGATRRRSLKIPRVKRTRTAETSVGACPHGPTAPLHLRPLEGSPSRDGEAVYSRRTHGLGPGTRRLATGPRSTSHAFGQAGMVMRNQEPADRGRHPNRRDGPIARRCSSCGRAGQPGLDATVIRPARRVDDTRCPHQGAAAGLAVSAMTLRDGIERSTGEHPEVTEVIDATDHGAGEKPTTRSLGGTGSRSGKQRASVSRGGWRRRRQGTKTPQADAAFWSA